jgi:hypothetical protein
MEERVKRKLSAILGAVSSSLETTRNLRLWQVVYMKPIFAESGVSILI